MNEQIIQQILQEIQSIKTRIGKLELKMQQHQHNQVDGTVYIKDVLAYVNTNIPIAFNQF